MTKVLYLAFVFTLLVSNTTNAAIYYVAQSHPNASDTNLGTEDQPWKTVQHAADNLLAGDTVRVKDGVYDSVAIVHSGEAGARIVYEAHPGNTPVIEGGLKIRHASYIAIRGFKVTLLGIDVKGPGVRDIIIDRNHIVDTFGSGISVWGTPWRSVPDDYDWLGAVDIVVSNNILERVLNEGWNEQITIANGVDKCEVFGNVIFDGGKTSTGGEGIDLKEGITNCSVHDNEIFGIHRTAIYVDGGRGTHAPSIPVTRNIEIYNNYIHDNGRTGISISTEGAGTVENVYVHHNRIEDQGWIGILVYIHPDKGSGEMRNILIEQNEIHNTYISNIQMNNPTAYETRIIDNLIDDDGVKVKRHPDDFFADNNGPWVVITPLSEPEPDPPSDPEPVTNVTFGNTGDYGRGNEHSIAVADMLRSKGADFMTTNGDNRYGNETMESAVGQAYGDFVAAGEFFPSIGNHDYGDGGGIDEYLAYFDLPGNERYYSVVRGPVEIFVINSEWEEPDGGGDYPSVQGVWLANAMAASTARWQFVFMHHPPFSSGAIHGSSARMQRWPFEELGADAVFSAHDHTYERILRDENGDGVFIPYFVNGLGGSTMYQFGTPIEGSQVRFNSEKGGMIVRVDDNTATFEFWTKSGVLIDSFTTGVPRGCDVGCWQMKFDALQIITTQLESEIAQLREVLVSIRDLLNQAH